MQGGGAAASAAAAATQQHRELLERYELVRVRGRGSFAQVWEARHRRTGLSVAVKILNLAGLLASGIPIRKGKQPPPSSSSSSSSPIVELERSVSHLEFLIFFLS